METTPEYTEGKSRDPRNPRLAKEPETKEPLPELPETRKIGSDEKNRLADKEA